MQRSLHILLMTILVFNITTGCATIIKGSRHNIEVTSDPQGATVKVEDILMTTPTILRLKGGNNYIVTIEKAGFEPVYTKIQSSLNGLVFLNLLVPPGFIVDTINGAAWSLEPLQINVKLKPL